MSKKKFTIQTNPFIVPTTDGKVIKEHFGNITDGNKDISMAHMKAPAGWSEPFQTPEFDEFTFIISGKKQFIIDNETVVLKAGESIKIERNTRVQYSNPFTEVCEYIAICTPAFSIDLVNRED
ncbi:cupin domain-containing protein [Algibacter sp. Ld11]|uniref:cupin domain-containing protein n=1 Tax=Algibacter sp. Ld11 TaxID=649150 RepID=UPI0038669967